MSIQTISSLPAATGNTAVPSRRFKQYMREGSRHSLSKCLAQELLALKEKYDSAGFGRIIERASRAIRLEGKRTPEMKTEEILCAIQTCAHETEDIWEAVDLERDEIKELIDAAVSSGKLVKVKSHRVHTGRGRRRVLYFTPAQCNEKPSRNAACNCFAHLPK
jgi:hypothetical protein